MDALRLLILQSFYYIICFHMLSLAQKPKLLDLCEQLHPIRYRWKVIGEQLKVKNGDIMAEKFIVSNDDTINLSKVLLFWMNQRGHEVCWKTIIDVIKDPPIENIHLANEICHFLAKPCNQKGRI